MSNNNGNTPQPPGLLPTKSQKSRRKISLPWFRQNSVTNPRAALSRQHTIDSPGSFRFFRQPSTNYPNQVKFLTFIINYTIIASDKSMKMLIHTFTHSHIHTVHIERNETKRMETF